MADEKNEMSIEERIHRAVAEEIKRLNLQFNQPESSKPKEEEDFECPECGAKVREGSKYCGNCGVELIWEEY